MEQLNIGPKTENESRVLSLKANSLFLDKLRSLENIDASIMFTSKDTVLITVGTDEFELRFGDINPTDSYTVIDSANCLSYFGKILGRCQVTKSRKIFGNSLVNCGDSIKKVNTVPTHKREISLLNTTENNDAKRLKQSSTAANPFFNQINLTNTTLLVDNKNVVSKVQQQEPKHVLSTTAQSAPLTKTVQPASSTKTAQSAPLVKTVQFATSAKTVQPVSPVKISTTPFTNQVNSLNTALLTDNKIVVNKVQQQPKHKLPTKTAQSASSTKGAQPAKISTVPFSNQINLLNTALLTDETNVVNKVQQQQEPKHTLAKNVQPAPSTKTVQSVPATKTTQSAATAAMPSGTSHPLTKIFVTNNMLRIRNIPIAVSLKDIQNSLFDGLSVAGIYISTTSSSNNNSNSNKSDSYPNIATVGEKNTVDVYVDFVSQHGAELGAMRSGEDLIYTTTTAMDDAATAAVSSSSSSNNSSSIVSSSVSSSSTAMHDGVQKKKHQIKATVQPVSDILVWWVKAVALRITSSSSKNISNKSNSSNTSSYLPATTAIAQHIANWKEFIPLEYVLSDVQELCTYWLPITTQMALQKDMLVYRRNDGSNRVDSGDASLHSQNSNEDCEVFHISRDKTGLQDDDPTVDNILFLTSLNSRYYYYHLTNNYCGDDSNKVNTAMSDQFSSNISIDNSNNNSSNDAVDFVLDEGIPLSDEYLANYVINYGIVRRRRRRRRKDIEINNNNDHSDDNDDDANDDDGDDGELVNNEYSDISMNNSHSNAVHNSNDDSNSSKNNSSALLVSKRIMYKNFCDKLTRRGLYHSTDYCSNSNSNNNNNCYEEQRMIYSIYNDEADMMLTNLENIRSLLMLEHLSINCISLTDHISSNANNANNPSSSNVANCIRHINKRIALFKALRKELWSLMSTYYILPPPPTTTTSSSSSSSSLLLKPSI